MYFIIKHLIIFSLFWKHLHKQHHPNECHYDNYQQY